MKRLFLRISLGAIACLLVAVCIFLNSDRYAFNYLSRTAKTIAPSDSASFIGKYDELYLRLLGIGSYSSNVLNVLPPHSNSDASNVIVWIHPTEIYTNFPAGSWRQLVHASRDGYFIIVDNGKVIVSLSAISAWSPAEAYSKYANVSIKAAEEFLKDK